nr:PREDICTED: interleukin-31 receptor subunit alpha-like isoform X2 [Latimeria chalumnae]|eukprot:XP_014353801.1 PREDICTED: interleukin-31 receptor subunit alpha-like isoform X2 [Latimeria chalumnae]
MNILVLDLLACLISLETGTCNPRDCPSFKDCLEESQVKCDPPEHIAYTRLSGILTLKWKSDLRNSYELQYSKRGQNWITENTSYTDEATLSKLEVSSPYAVRLRCVPQALCRICDWSSNISIPLELTEKPEILQFTVEKLLEGKRNVYAKWKVTHDVPDGYNVTVERKLTVERMAECNVFSYFETNVSELNLIVSGTSYKILVSSYNSAGKSPSTEIIIPPVGKIDLPGQINATAQGNDSILITWNPKHICNIHSYVIDWGPVIGNGISDVKSKMISHKNSCILSGVFEPMKRYRLILHTQKENPCDTVKNLNNSESTYGMTDVYTVEGVPRSAPANVTIHNITAHSAVVTWNEIPEDDCQGFLQNYIVHCSEKDRNKSFEIMVNSSTTAYLFANLARQTTYSVEIAGATRAGKGVRSSVRVFHTLSYDHEEEKIIILIVCFGSFLFVILLARICSFTFVRMKKLCWPVIPNPVNSSAMQEIEKFTLLIGLEHKAKELPQMERAAADDDEDASSLHVYEEGLVAPLMVQPLILETDGNSHIESNGKPAHSAISQTPEMQEVVEKSTVSENESVAINTKPEVPPISNYTTMDFILQVMPNLSVAGNNVAQVQTGQKTINQLSSQEQQKEPLVMDYVKQSQLINIVANIDLCKSTASDATSNLKTPGHFTTLCSVSEVTKENEKYICQETAL